MLFFYCFNETDEDDHPESRYFLFDRHSATRCRARLIVTNDKPEPIMTGSHAHAPDGRILDVSQIRNHIRETINQQVGVPTRTIVVDALGQAKAATAAIMPTTQALTKQVSRLRRAKNIPNIPKSIDQIVIPEFLQRTLKDENFILHDDGPAAEDRMIIFGTTKNLNMVNRAEIIYADGTFDVSPLLFKQMYSIHGEEFISSKKSIRTNLQFII